MNTLLGICIPTYKRPDQLVQCIHSIITAARPYDVPIFVADDSADATNDAAYIELHGVYPHIYVTRNSTNLGIDRNILNSVSICTCEYAWIIGEDDRLLPSGIEEVLSLLSGLDHEHWPFIYANYASVDAGIHYYLKQRVLPLQEDLIEIAEHFFIHHAWAAGFIGGCVINTKAWAKIEPAPYIGTYFAHVGIIMEMLHGFQVYLIARPQVLNRCGELRLFTWSDVTFPVAGGWRQMTRQLEPFYGVTICQQAAQRFEDAHGLYTCRFLCYARADYAYRYAHYLEYIRPMP